MSEHVAEHAPHVLPVRSYLGVWGALLALTGLTVGVSYFEFGSWNIVIALVVATIKATLVASVFMHLAYDKKFNAVVFLASVIFLVIMLSFTFLDTGARGIAEQIEGQRPKDYRAPFEGGRPVTVAGPEARP